MFRLIIGASAIAWLFTFLPAIEFLRRNRKIRFENLLARFSEDAIKLYCATFLPSETVPADAGLNEYFKKRMKSHYGQGLFVLPIFMWTVISGIVLALIALSVLKWLGLANLTPIPPIATAALLGALMWTTNDQIWRSGTGDLTPRDVYNWCHRFLIAVPIGYSLAFTVKDDLGIPLAFLLGTFPSNTLMTYGRRFVTKQLDVGDEPASSGKSELELLQGINRPEAERFREEGISTVLQLAYSDPVMTTLRTNYDFNFIIDVVSQALLWLYLDKNIELPKLRILGLRGAYEAATLAIFLRSGDPKTSQTGQKNLEELAKVLDVDPEAFKKTLFEVSEDPYTEFNVKLWNLPAL